MKSLALKNLGDLTYNRLFLVRSVLMAVHSLLLVGFVAYQFAQPLFLNATTWVWAYMCLFVCFAMDFIFFYSHCYSGQSSERKWALTEKPLFGGLGVAMDTAWRSGSGKVPFGGLGVAVDTAFLTLCLGMALPALSSVLIFIYMLSIFGAGLLWQYKGALVQGFWVSFLFSCVLLFKPSFVEGYPSLVFAFVLNNLGFMVVTGLSGFFGAQAKERDWLIGLGDTVTDQLENLNELIVENMNMGLFILDEETHIIHSNTQARKILGLPFGFSAPLRQVFPELRENLVSDKKKDLNRMELEYQAETEKKTIEVFLSPIKGIELSEKQKHLVLFQDWTQARVLEKKAQEKEKLAGIGRMAVGIAHEIRNPLSSVGGSIQLLDLDNKNKAENKRLMDMALREISRLNSIIGEFLSYTSDESALSNLKTEIVDVNSVLEELLDSVRVNPHWDHIKHHATLKAHGLVEGRADKFKQVFWNVVKNACEAMASQKEGFLTLESFDDGEWVVIRVKDTGPGISAQDKPFIYEPFYSKKAKGSGLGLSIARKLVLFYKGLISQEPVEGGGTLFDIRFPLNSNPVPGELARKAS